MAIEGGYVVIWSSDDQDGGRYGIYGQRYTSDGVRVGGEFRINDQTAGSQYQEPISGSSSIAVTNDGMVVVVWDENDGLGEIEHRRFDTIADPQGVQDTAIAMPITMLRADTDGSESITALSLSGVPAGATISDGQNAIVSTETPSRFGAGPSTR